MEPLLNPLGEPVPDLADEAAPPKSLPLTQAVIDTFLRHRIRLRLEGAAEPGGCDRLFVPSTNYFLEVTPEGDVNVAERLPDGSDHFITAYTFNPNKSWRGVWRLLTPPNES